MISLIIPAYNEEARIRPTLEAYDDYLRELGGAYEIVVVDDGSEDGTARLVRDMGKERPNLFCIDCATNRGKGHAVRLGMLAARGDVRIFCDADGATQPDQLPRLLAPIDMGEAQVSIASRYVDGATVDQKQPWYRQVWSRLSNQVVQAILLPGIQDTQCGFKAMTAEAAERVFTQSTIRGWSFDLEMLALARMHGFEIIEVPVHWSDDADSRMNPLRDAVRNVQELVRIRLRMSRLQLTGA